MHKNIITTALLTLITLSAYAQGTFPDGSAIDSWFTQKPARQSDNIYVITDHGVKKGSESLQTEAIQEVIDLAAANGGGTVVIPEGTFHSGSLFFKPGTSLHLDKGAELRGSDDISDFAIIDTRLEGQCLKYFAALVNAIGVDGFSITGKGKINGNGLRYWKSFWLRRTVNPQCTNLEELRPRLVYIANSNDVLIEGVRLENSPFWTTHLYKCERVRIYDADIFAPAAPVRAPSSDAIDIDACSYIHVKDCRISVNDDAIALKGGKGPWADQSQDNGANTRIIIENCHFGFCHSAVTCGSESIHNRNIIFRNSTVDKADRLLWLKMRPDTPQNYEYITVEDITGNVGSFIYVKPWTQFFDLKGRKDTPMSYASHITMKDITLACKTFFNVISAPDQYLLKNFIFENLDIKAEHGNYDRTAIDNFVTNNVSVRRDDLAEGFSNPSMEYRPQVWWHWMNGNVTKDGIRKDIEWFNRIGIGGFHIFDASFSTPQIVEKRLVYMTDEWKDAFSYAVSLADSLGMDVTVPSSPGFSSTGGPWVGSEDAMKKVVWREIEVEGGKKINIELPKPYTIAGKFQNYGMKTSASTVDSKPVDNRDYDDIGVVAVRLPDTYRTLASLGAKITSSGGEFTLEQLTNGDLTDNGCLPAEKCGFAWIQYEFPEPQTIRSLSMINEKARDERHAYPATCLDSLQISDNGIDFTTVFGIPVGDAIQQTISFKPLTAKYFRLKKRNPKAVYHYSQKVIPPDPDHTDIAEFVLYPETRINHFEEKAGCASAHDVELNPTPVPDDEICQEVVDLSPYVKNGRLVWKAPKGHWRIYRLGASLTGKQNHPAPPEATGFEVDKLDKKAWKKHFRNYLDMNKTALNGKLGAEGIGYVLVDSYEAGHQNWTPKMREEFIARRGYDPLPWYPVLTGLILKSADQSERFLWDWRKTIGELFEENYAVLDSLVKNEYGMAGCFVETHGNGRAFINDGMSVKRHAEIPMSEIWVQCKAGSQNRVREGISDIRESSSVSHVYGKKRVAAESFTVTGAGGEAYKFAPADLKWTADLEMSQGLNMFVIHDSAHQPLDDVKPGIGLGVYGQWFNRHDTWAEQAGPWMDYLARSSFMLSQGTPVSDILWYYGEDNNITGLYSWGSPEIPEGFDFDYIDPSGLMTEISAIDGLAVTAYGKKYRVLCLDANCARMSMTVLKKIASLATEGVLICGQVPQRAASMTDSQEEFEAIVKDVWHSGRKNVYADKLPAEVLETRRVEPDWKYAGADELRVVHRSIDGGEIYWICNPSAAAQKNVEISLRTKGYIPMKWHPETGEISEVTYRFEGGRTILNLDFDQLEAYFIVLRDKTKAKEGKTVHAPTETMICELQVDGLGCWTEKPETRYFSGTRSYKHTLDIPELKGRLLIDLGNVHTLAQVFVDGQHAGTLWKAPYKADITGLVRGKSKVELEIKVTNTWRNNLIGDAAKPVNERTTYTTFGHFYSGKEDLSPAGLIGPVTLIEAK